ncbi:MAG: type II toxin-antitoxin system RelE/ParE family toxin [Bacteroidetes bacterium]|nr:type II toxin-antitoxin system RelE/ParE family toxin [Bacteroidota bacterium]
MNYKVLTTQRFSTEIKRLQKKYPSIKEEFAQLIELLENNPITGVSIGKNCYKIRLSIASKGKGKSGGARVITYVYFENECVYLMSIYDKSEKENIKPSEIKKMIESLDF